MNWEEAIKQAQEKQKKYPYGRSFWNDDPEKVAENNGEKFIEGATVAQWWKGQSILRAGNCVSCVYTVFETFMEAMRSLGMEDEDNDWEITAEDMQTLKEWCFVYDEGKRKGLPGGLVELGLGAYVDPSEARLGDVAQFYNVSKSTGKTVFGHSVVLWGMHGSGSLDTWSAENSDGLNGNAFNWRYIKSNNYNREWYVARPDWA